MKKIILIIFILNSIFLYSIDTKRKFLEEKIELLIKDLENHNPTRLIHYFKPEHIIENVEVFIGEDFTFSESELEHIIRDWGFWGDEGKLKSLKEIKKVLGFSISDQELTLEIELENASIIKISTFIDWNSLTFFGVSG
jgi:hypothetical protein